MDFSGWKKIKEDAKCCTLVHPKGHQMTILMRGLPKIQQEQIKRLKLAEGGEVKYDRPELAKKGEAILKEKHKISPEGKKRNEKFWGEAERTFRPVTKYAEGGATGNTDDADIESELEKNLGPMPGKSAPVTINIGAPGITPNPSTPDQQSISAPPQKGQPVTTVPVPKNPNPLLPDQTINAPGAVEQQQKAIQQQVPIDIVKAREEARIQQEAIEKQNDIATMQMNNLNELKGHTDEFANYIQSNPINPKAYQENMSTGSKVATAIGLFAGGMGVPFGGHNFASDYLNKQINRDIEAQQKRADNQKTVWGAYHNLYGDANVATNLAKVSANDIVVHKTALAAKQVGTAQARQNANSLAAQKQIENNQLLIDAAGRLGILRTGGRMPGKPGQPGTAAPGAQPPSSQNENPEGAKTYKILAPNSKDLYNMAQYIPKLKDQRDQLFQQWTQAQQTEKVLNGPNNDGIGGIHDIMQKMYEASKKMGAYGHIHREGKNALEAIPLVGNAAGAATGVMPGTKSEKEYNGTMATLEADLGTALAGLMTPTDIHNAIRANAPAYLDEPEEVDAKEKRVVQQIIKANRTSLLEGANMLHREKKAK